MENYIVINGKKAELTEEQLVALGIEIKKNDPFELNECDYYYIDSVGNVAHDFYCDGCKVTERRHDIANYCADKDLMQQRALHENLNRLLWRYSMQHDGDKINYECDFNAKWYVYYNTNLNQWSIGSIYHSIYFDIYFYTEKIARNAIEEIIKPFIKEHPDFYLFKNI